MAPAYGGPAGWLARKPIWAGFGFRKWELVGNSADSRQSLPIQPVPTHPKGPRTDWSDL